jgi:hypothetical protein
MGITVLVGDPNELPFNDRLKLVPPLTLTRKERIPLVK